LTRGVEHQKTAVWKGNKETMKSEKVTHKKRASTKKRKSAKNEERYAIRSQGPPSKGPGHNDLEAGSG